MPLRELLFLRMSLFLCVKDGKRRRVVRDGVQNTIEASR